MANKNLLLACLPRDVYARIEPDLKPVSLPQSQVLHRPGEEIRDLYFPTTCMISITITMGEGQTVEAGAIGNREVVGINAFMGGCETTQTEYIVQIPGDALRIDAAPLKEEFNRNTEMRDVMLKYTQAMIAQISQNVGCNRIHALDERCARWLLEVRECVESDEFPLTHEFISEMLGVRRAGVTEAALGLKERGLINYSRGHIQIIDIQGLEAASCECYQVLKDEYDRLLGVRLLDGQAEPGTAG
ncbi:MAG TPA: Crp/Fnr family transcriptional regulator [Pyrinomonadaceae bacterium]|nr:Crp/Fnr family transcriptional regulator [Pyrinomonadaceae bacterium]